jgi:hypothetical protein
MRSLPDADHRLGLVARAREKRCSLPFCIGAHSSPEIARIQELTEAIPVRPDGTPDIGGIERPVKVMTPGEQRELTWRLERQGRFEPYR